MDIKKSASVSIRKTRTPPLSIQGSSSSCAHSNGHSSRTESCSHREVFTVVSQTKNESRARRLLSRQTQPSDFNWTLYASHPPLKASLPQINPIIPRLKTKKGYKAINATTPPTTPTTPAIVTLNELPPPKNGTVEFVPEPLLPLPVAATTPPVPTALPTLVAEALLDDEPPVLSD